MVIEIMVDVFEEYFGIIGAVLVDEFVLVKLNGVIIEVNNF